MATNMDKVSIQEFAYRVQNEGLEYTILDYYSLDDIEDEELRILCQKACNALRDIQEFIEPFYDEGE